MTKGIANSIFSFLDSLTILRNDQYARYLSTEVFWAIFPVESNREEVVLKLEDELLDMIRTRVEENKKGYYSPLFRVLINIYGFQFHAGVRGLAKIGTYVEEEFKNYFAQKILEDSLFEKKFLPTDCSVDRVSGIIKDCNGDVMFQAMGPDKPVAIAIERS